MFSSSCAIPQDSTAAAARLLRRPLNVRHQCVAFPPQTMDATANPHIALAAIIVAGLQGIVHRLELPPPVAADPSKPAMLGCLQMPDVDNT